MVQVKFNHDITITDIRTSLNGLDLKDISVQGFGEANAHEYLIRTASSKKGEKSLYETISAAITKAMGNTLEIRRVRIIGPQVGQDLKRKALLAIFYSLLFITIYISGRFELKWVLSGITAGGLIAAAYFLSFFNMSMPLLIAAAMIVSLVIFWALNLQFAMGAIVALTHDVTTTVGVFPILNLDFSLSIIAALLVIIGYSLNDTIIVFDRIRDNIKGAARESLPALFNKSINETPFTNSFDIRHNIDSAAGTVLPGRGNHTKLCLCHDCRCTNWNLFIHICGEPNCACRQEQCIRITLRKTQQRITILFKIQTMIWQANFPPWSQNRRAKWLLIRL